MIETQMCVRIYTNQVYNRQMVEKNYISYLFDREKATEIPLLI